jgi:hypothetical protein
MPSCRELPRKATPLERLARNCQAIETKPRRIELALARKTCSKRHAKWGSNHHSAKLEEVIQMNNIAWFQRPH